MWGYAIAASGLVVAVLGPVLGAIADAGGRRKPWLAACSAVTIGGALLLWYATPEPYRAGDRFSQELGRWNPHLGSADSDYLRSRDSVVARVRDLTCNNGWASGAVTRMVDQADGATFRLSARPDWMALDQSPEWSRDWEEVLEQRAAVLI